MFLIKNYAYNKMLALDLLLQHKGVILNTVYNQIQLSTLCFFYKNPRFRMNF